MLCPNCKVGVMRIEEPKKEYDSKPYFVCIACQSVFEINLRYILGTQYIPINDQTAIQKARLKATPKKKDRPEFFTFND